MRFLNDDAPAYDLTYSDVFMVPSLSSVSSRQDVDLSTPDGLGTTIPLVVANMTAVAGRRMAETVARRGGLVVLPQDIPLDVIADNIGYVKSRHRIYETPIELGPSNTVADALSLIHKRSHGAVVVTENHRPVGIFTERDATGFDRFTQLQHVMTRELVTVVAGTPLEEIFERLSNERFSFAPVVDSEGSLVGCVTRRGALRSALYEPAVDVEGRLQVAVAVGINGSPATKAKELAGLGVDVLVIDTAHGHQAKMLDALAEVRRSVPDLPIVAGNVVTAVGHARPDRCGRRHRQGRCRPRSDVHDADDDRCRPAAVLRRARMCRSCTSAGQARLGGRRSAVSARRRPRPRRRCRQRDVRFVARRDARVGRRHDA